MKTLVLGASENPQRYSYKAILALRQYQHEVVAVGNKSGQVGDVVIHAEATPFVAIDTITLYLNPKAQEQYYNYILQLRPRRILFNPGAENKDLSQLAQQNGIEIEEACTLVLLSSNQY